MNNSFIKMKEMAHKTQVETIRIINIVPSGKKGKAQTLFGLPKPPHVSVEFGFDPHVKLTKTKTQPSDDSN